MRRRSRDRRQLRTALWPLPRRGPRLAARGKKKARLARHGFEGVGHDHSKTEPPSCRTAARVSFATTQPREVQMASRPLPRREPGIHGQNERGSHATVSKSDGHKLPKPEPPSCRKVVQSVLGSPGLRRGRPRV